MAADLKKGHESSERDVRDKDARGYRKVRRGYVTSDKMDKTIVVEVEDRVKHPPVWQGCAPFLQSQGTR